MTRDAGGGSNWEEMSLAGWKRTEEYAAETREENRREKSDDRGVVVSGVEVGELKSSGAAVIGQTRVRP